MRMKAFHSSYLGVTDRREAALRMNKSMRRRLVVCPQSYLQVIDNKQLILKKKFHKRDKGVELVNYKNS